MNTHKDRGKALSTALVKDIYDALVLNARLPKGDPAKRTQHQLARDFEVNAATVSAIKQGKHGAFMRGELEWNALAVMDTKTHRANAYRQQQIISAYRMLKAGLITKESFNLAKKDIDKEYKQLMNLSLFKRKKVAVLKTVEGQHRMKPKAKPAPEPKEQAQEEETLYGRRIELESAVLLTQIQKGERTLEQAHKILLRDFHKDEAESYYQTIVSLAGA